MKKILYSLFIASSIAFVVSCADESLDPLPTNTAIKGTILALRGDQLQSIYVNSEPYGASFMADNIKGTETFDYEAEFLSGDLTSLASIDVNVLKKTKTGGATTSEKVLLTNIPFSAFKTDGKYVGPYVQVSVKLSDILAKIGMTNNTTDLLDSSNVYGFNIDILTDLNLTDGTKVVSDQLIAAGLYQSNQFYPAQQLKYGVTTQESFRPTLSISTKTGLPLKDGAADTVLFKYSEKVSAPTAVTFSPANAGTLGTLAGYPAKKPDGKSFYAVFTAGSAYTGNVSVKASGAVAASTGLAQNPKSGTVKTDNIAPVLLAFDAGTRVGKGGSTDITILFNEKIGKAPVLKFDIGTTNVNKIADAKMTLSADGLSATYTYDFKDDADAVKAVYGDVAVTATGLQDVAGNAIADVAGSFTVDITTPEAPTITLASPYDFGTQIKWSIDETTALATPNTSTSGTVYFIVLSGTADAPTGFVNGDDPAFILGQDEDEKDILATPTGSESIDGSTGEIFTAFTPNGVGLKVYAVFVSDTGNVSVISAATVVDMTN